MTHANNNRLPADFRSGTEKSDRPTVDELEKKRQRALIHMTSRPSCRVHLYVEDMTARTYVAINSAKIRTQWRKEWGVWLPDGTKVFTLDNWAKMKNRPRLDSVQSVADGLGITFGDLADRELSYTEVTEILRAWRDKDDIEEPEDDDESESWKRAETRQGKRVEPSLPCRQHDDSLETVRDLLSGPMGPYMSMMIHWLKLKHDESQQAL
ncbi:hypothetical protein Pan216_12810 [Planctomycetes bacterium Pan216]|uniref:Uncharacterized protein n=1 Tax=Kolteria novifilia TaxID=2527975 RepID=A0A518B0H9_9BACT|nr:hypothetical protein Pan216_12810 [Planctomycetes bacterium Pan216]